MNFEIQFLTFLILPGIFLYRTQNTGLNGACSEYQMEINNTIAPSIQSNMIQYSYIVDGHQIQKTMQKLPKNPSKKELKEIGSTMLSALKKWKDEPTFKLADVLKSSKFKPFSEKNYIADWYLDKNGYSLYCMRMNDGDIRLSFHIQFRNIAGKWKAMKPEIEKIWKVK